MKTKFKIWKSSGAKSKVDAAKTRLEKSNPDINFEVVTRTWAHKSKKSFSVRSVVRKGTKR